MNTHKPQHLSAERLQAFLDGDLSPREISSVEGHLSSCARCSAEVEGWRVLYSELGALASVRPHEGFGDRVMASVSISPPISLAARLRDRVPSWLSGSREGHIAPDKLEDLLEGFLPARHAARIESHLSACEACALEATALQRVFSALDSVRHLNPTDEFADRVMVQVRVPARVTAPAKVRVWSRAAALGSKLVPQTREAWAAVSGVALTPAVTIGLVMYAVFSHPSLTPGALASYLWWQLSDAASAGGSAVAAFALESLQASGMSSLLGMVASAPLLVAVGFTAYAVACLFALRVLYKNLVSSRPLGGRYAHVSVS